MPGLPHYNNSKASTKRYEPMYGSLFEVNLLPPSGVAGGPILLEHVLSISGLENEKGEAAAEQKFKTSTRSYAQAGPESTTVDLAINFSLNLDENNGLYVYKTLRDWKRLVFNPLTGEEGLKKDYIGIIIVSNYNRPGDIFWQRTFNDCWPVGTIPELPLDYSTVDPLELTVTFRSDWWSETTL